MQRRMQAHQRIAAFPAELQQDVLSWLRTRRFRTGNVQDTAWRLALAGVGDRNPLAILPHQHALIAGLAAAERVEDGSIQLDAALVHPEDAGHDALEISIFAEQKLGRHAVSSV